jgi:hypothetical protein
MQDQENIITELNEMLQQLRDENQALQRLIHAVDRQRALRDSLGNPPETSKTKKSSKP